MIWNYIIILAFWYAAIIQISYTLFIMNGINQNSSLSLKMFS
ncbi:unknown [Prevotella sp. CAG:386]|nr:unknown [Prevotella sp. CAG:386]